MLQERKEESESKTQGIDILEKLDQVFISRSSVVRLSLQSSLDMQDADTVIEPTQTLSPTEMCQDTDEFRNCPATLSTSDADTHANATDHLDKILALCRDLEDAQVCLLIEKLLEQRTKVKPKPLKDAKKKHKKTEKKLKDSKKKVGRLEKKIKASRKIRKRLETQITDAGLEVAEDIPYKVCVAQIRELWDKMDKLDPDIELEDKEEQKRIRAEYFHLQREYDRYNVALVLTKEFKEEEKQKVRAWEESIAKNPLNDQALRNVRKHIPVAIRSLTTDELTSPECSKRGGQALPRALANKLKRTNVLQLFRLDPAAIERMHPVQLESLGTTPLTLTERRALHLHFREPAESWSKGKENNDRQKERKYGWYTTNFLEPFKKMLVDYETHEKDYGEPGPQHKCPLLGRACPFKADIMQIDYAAKDFGYPEEPVYDVIEVAKAGDTQEDLQEPQTGDIEGIMEDTRRTMEESRMAALKEHYEGKLLKVKRANAVCESMDLTMDRIELRLLQWCRTIADLSEDLEWEFNDEQSGDESRSLWNVQMQDTDKKKQVIRFRGAMNDIKHDVIDLCKISGMATSGARNSTGSEDTRSAIECGLAEEVCESARELIDFIEEQMEEMNERDTQLSKAIEWVEDVIEDLHEQNLATLSTTPQTDRPERSRELKTKDHFMDIAWAEKEAKLEAKREQQKREEEEGLRKAELLRKSRPNPMGGRPGAPNPLLAAIQKRQSTNLSGCDSSKPKGGPNGGGLASLLAAISARSA